MATVQSKTNTGEGGKLNVADVKPYIESGKYTEVTDSAANNQAYSMLDKATQTPAITQPRPTKDTPTYMEQIAAIDENKIREEEMKRQQARIDAINQLYVDEYRRANERAYGREGTQRAQSAARGIIGSDFQGQEMKAVTDVNEAERRAIDAQKAAEIAAVYGKVDENTMNRVAQARSDVEKQQALLMQQQQAADEQALKERQFGLQERELAMNEAKLKLQNEGRKVTEVGDYLVDSNTGEVIFQAPAKQSASFEKLSPGQTLYDPVTGKAIYTAPETNATKSTSKVVNIGGTDYLMDEYGNLTTPNVPINNTQTPQKTAQIEALDTAIETAKKYADAAGRSGWKEWIARGLFGNTDVTALENASDTIKTNLLTLASDPNVKKFFGPQMSNADVRLMMSGGTILDPIKQGKEEFIKELNRVTDLVDRIKKAVPSSTTQDSTNQNEERLFLQEQGYNPEDIDKLLGKTNDLSTSQNGSIKLGSNLARLNNNPGNLRFVGQAGASQGAGGFARFETPQAGVQALKNQIKLDASRGHTLQSFISKYAPPTENDTALYIQQLSQRLGVSPQTAVSTINLDALTREIMKKESSSTIG